MPGKERALAPCLPRTFETPRELEKPSQTKGVMAPKAKEPVPNTAHGRQRLRRDGSTETPSVKPRPDKEATSASSGRQRNRKACSSGFCAHRTERNSHCPDRTPPGK